MFTAEQEEVRLRMMAFNIWRGGSLDGRAGDDGAAENRRQLVEFLRHLAPDVLFIVETYGSGEEIVAGINEGLPADRCYTGVQITVEPDLGRTFTGDNLWLITRLDVEKIYPRSGDGDLTSFNFGGARLGLPTGQHIHAFTVWLYHAPSAPRAVNEAALESMRGSTRTCTDEEIIATDRDRRLGMATTLLRQRLASFVGRDDAPVFLGGDFNTLSPLDWSKQFSDAPGHGGLVLDWPVMRMFDDAGFIDTYRRANPDAAASPGVTLSSVDNGRLAPCRIDYILMRGAGVDVVASHTVTRRLDHHRGSGVDAVYPFYSDHAAVISDVLIHAGSRP